MGGEQQEMRSDVGAMPPTMPAGPGPVPAAVDEPVVPRIGRTERDVIEGRLRQALLDDVITITEFDERLGAVIAARTQPELDRIVADLPHDHDVAAAAAVLDEQPSVVAFMSSTEQRGRWRPAKPVRVSATMGNVVLDLREAVTDDGTFTVEGNAFMGNVEVIAPDNAHVTMTGTAAMGARENTVPTPAGPGPRVQVNVDAVMGSVKVRPATKRERRRHPVDGEAPTAKGLQRTAPRPGGWVGRAAAAALLVGLALGPGRAALGADQVAIFGSGAYEPNAAQLQGTDDVDVFVLFGSAQVVVPEGYRARNEIVPLFGSAQCEGPCFTATTDGAELPPTVTVDGMTLFGSAEITGPEHALD